MFLGTPRTWWIAAAVPLVLGFGLLATSDGTMQRTAVAIVLLLVAMGLFGMAPMRYGQGARTPPQTEAMSPTTPIVPSDVAQQRPTITSRDASEV